MADTTATFSESGAYVLRLTADDRELSASDELAITVSEGGEITTVQVRVASGSDDAEERASGSMRVGSSDLELVIDGGGNQTVGMRFNGLDMRQDAAIVNAHIQFQVDETTSVLTSLTIQGEDADNASAFTSSAGNISSRPRTTAAVLWDPVPWTTVGEASLDQRTSDIASVIQEIVNRAGWSSGNSLVTIITGSSERVPESYDGVQNAAPLLHVEYSAQ